MRNTAKIPVGLLIAGVLVGLLLAAILLVGSCTAMLWNTLGGDAEAGARRDALRARHGALVAQLAATAGEGSDMLDAAARLRSIVLPPQALGLAITQSDSDDNRIVILRNYDGRQTGRLLINGAGTVTLVGKDGETRTFDLLETDATLRDGTIAEIELVLAPDALAEGPE